MIALSTPERFDIDQFAEEEHGDMAEVDAAEGTATETTVADDGAGSSDTEAVSGDVIEDDVIEGEIVYPGDPRPQLATDAQPPLTAAEARDLFQHTVQTYVVIDANLTDMLRNMAEFVARRGWESLGYRSAALMVKGERATLVNPLTQRPLSDATVNRFSRWIEMMSLIYQATGVPVDQVDFPARVLQQLPSGRGRGNDRELASRIGEDARALAAAEGSDMPTPEQTQQVIDDLLVEAGVVPKDRRKTTDAPDPDELPDDDENAADAGSRPPPAHQDASPNGHDTGGGDTSDDDHVVGDQPFTPPPAQDGPGIEAAIAQAQQWETIRGAIDALTRAAAALPPITAITDAGTGFLDTVYERELPQLRTSLGKLPDFVDLCRDCRAAVAETLAALKDREELGI